MCFEVFIEEYVEKTRKDNSLVICDEIEDVGGKYVYVCVGVCVCYSFADGAWEQTIKQTTLN